MSDKLLIVLNLVINGLPSILQACIDYTKKSFDEVLNLVINGLPSILQLYLLGGV